LIRLVLAFACLCGSAEADITLSLNGVFRWQQDAPWFGGWSGIEVGADGTQMTLISDRGQIIEADLSRTDGQVTDLHITKSTRLSHPDGRRLTGTDTDAEGLATGEDGRSFVSFEHRHRIMEVDRQTGRSFGQIKVPFEQTLDNNGGIEALAIGPDGTLFALSERRGPGGAPFLLHAYSDGAWRVAAQIPRRGPFVPVGADVDPMGRLWLLERTLTPLGFRSRIRMFTLNPRAPSEVTLLTTGPARHDNLEGISLWQDAGGQLYLTMISDDNFLRIQQTQIVEYLVLE